MAKPFQLDPIQGLDLLIKTYPNSQCSLVYRNPFELLIATILSAQCTDERVNKVTSVLFSIYPTAQSLAQAGLPQIEAIIRPTGFYKNKAKSLHNVAQSLCDQFHGEVPPEMEELVKLKGVGRKTANVVLGNAFDKITGIVVDTHVHRLSNRWRWSKHTDPIKIEKDLMKLIPKNQWVLISHLMIDHGRELCKARKPLCKSCFLFDLCPQFNV